MNRQTYSVEALEHFQEILRSKAKNRPNGIIEFQVLLDKTVIIPRTSNLEMLESIPDSVTPKARLVEIKVFRASSNFYDIYGFDVVPDQQPAPIQQGYQVPQAVGLGGFTGTLNGLEGLIEEKVNQRLSADELQRTKNELLEAKSKIEALQGRVDEYERLEQEAGTAKMIGQLAGHSLGHTITEFLRNSPLSSTPLGALVADRAQTMEMPQHTPHAQVVEDDPDIQPLGATVEEMDPESMQFVAWFANAFPAPYQDQVLHLLGQLAQDPTKIATLLSLLK